MVGVILCAWQSEDLIDACLAPWLAAKRARLGGQDWSICAVSVPFEGFPQDETRDRTRSILGAYAHTGDIDHVIVSDKPIKETEARGAALRWLVAKGADLSWQVDSDEVYAETDIVGALRWVEANPYAIWHRLALRNAVFDEHTYLVEPFTPPRIHRIHTPGGYVADGFWDDNNVRYTRPCEREKMNCSALHDIQMAHMTIPAGVCNPRHLSWLSNARSKAKIAYQLAGRGWPECSFRWDEETDSLKFNEAYYARRGLPLPEVIDSRVS